MQLRFVFHPLPCHRRVDGLTGCKGGSLGHKRQVATRGQSNSGHVENIASQTAFHARNYPLTNAIFVRLHVSCDSIDKPLALHHKAILAGQAGERVRKATQTAKEGVVSAPIRLF